MKYLAGLVFLNGLLFVYSSLSNFIEGTSFRFIDYTIAPVWNLSGLLVGIPLCLSAIGMLMKKTFFYTLSLILYRILIIYIGISWILLLVKGPLNQAWAPVFIASIHIFIYYLIQRAIAKARKTLIDAQDMN